MTSLFLSDTSQSPALPADPEEMLALLEQLDTIPDFWRIIANWVEPDHLQRRQAYYAKRFAHARPSNDQLLFWLRNDFYSDVACQDDFFRALVGRPPIAECPFRSRADFEDYLATITTISDWPGRPDPPFDRDDYDVIADLVQAGIVPPSVGLLRLKDWARNKLDTEYTLPVLPLS